MVGHDFVKRSINEGDRKKQYEGYQNVLLIRDLTNFERESMENDVGIILSETLDRYTRNWFERDAFKELVSNFP